MPDLGNLHPAGCNGKIDFLFVISRFGYMETMQTRLIEAFPNFIATIESKFADFDYHIMVVDGVETWGSQVCNEYSDGKPKLWAEAITSAKHGDPNSVVMFSILEPECNPCDQICDLVKYYFPYWHIADNDDLDYGPAFDVATGLVDQACSAFIPK